MISISKLFKLIHFYLESQVKSVTYQLVIFLKKFKKKSSYHIYSTTLHKSSAKTHKTPPKLARYYRNEIMIIHIITLIFSLKYSSMFEQVFQFPHRALCHTLLHILRSLLDSMENRATKPPHPIGLVESKFRPRHRYRRLLRCRLKFRFS